VVYHNLKGVQSNMNLSEARARKLLTASRLAALAGMSRAGIYAIESGRNIPTLETVRKLSEVLEVDPMEVEEFRSAIEKTAQRKKEPARVMA
jgi:DNA-binding XRE family transcriptional regulator